MKKATRAYKVGFTDGQKGKHNNTYTEGQLGTSTTKKVSLKEKHHE